MSPPTPDRRPLLIAAVFVLLFVGGLGGWPTVRAQLCPSILVASSNEKAQLMASLAKDYSRTHPVGAWAGCGDAVRVEQVASGAAESRLRDGWSDAATRPDVWAPAASTWVLLLRQDVAGHANSKIVSAGPWPPIAESPLIVAMPDQMARALGWPGVQPTWKELLQLADDPAGWGARGHPEWGAFRLGKTDPDRSTSGIHTLIAEYYAATGKSSNLVAADLQAPATRQFLDGVEASVSHYAPTAGDFLSNVASAGDASDYISAIPVEEQEVFNYNRGSYSADRLPPRDPLDAVYPAGGTLVADHPFVVLDASWVSNAQRQIADAFRTWLQDAPQQARFAGAGFRSFQLKAGVELAGDPGVIPGQPVQTLTAPDPLVLAAIVKSWQGFRKNARLLLVLDLTTAAQRDAVAKGVQGLSGQDEVGVWTTSPPSRQPPGLLQNQRAPVLAAITSAPLDPRPTALYATIDAAYRTLSGTPDPSRINAIVVIAAGRDDGAAPTLTQLEREVRTRPGGVPVRIYTVALEGSDRQALLGIERASGGYASPPENAADAIQTGLANF